MVVHPDRPDTQHGEREFSLEASARRAFAALTELDLTPRLRFFGGEPTAWECELFAAGASNAVTNGYGKGDTLEAMVGAVYEALEHYLTQRHSLVLENVELRRCADIAQSALGGEGYGALLAQQPDQLIACRSYAHSDTSAQLAVPLFLSNVWWVEDDAADLRRRLGDTTDYSALARYSTNSGCAIGSSFAEAAVHAINEAVERDAFSLFVARTFLSPTPDPPTVLAVETLPSNLRDLVERAQARVGRDIRLVDITSDLSIPAIMAYAPGPPGRYLRGCGASLSPQHAVYRAVTELVQSDLTDSGYTDMRVANVERLTEYPALQACAGLQLPGLTTSPQVAYTPALAPTSPAGHLHELQGILGRHGFSTYFDRIHTAGNGIATVHMHIPGLERFHLITEGSVVLPGNRARAAIRHGVGDEIVNRRRSAAAGR